MYRETIRLLRQYGGFQQMPTTSVVRVTDFRADSSQRLQGSNRVAQQSQEMAAVPRSVVAVRCARQTLQHRGPLFHQPVWKLESWLAYELLNDLVIRHNSFQLRKAAL